MPNWDIGMGPKPGPWGTEAEEVATAEEERRDMSTLKPQPGLSLLGAD